VHYVAMWTSFFSRRTRSFVLCAPLRPNSFPLLNAVPWRLTHFLALPTLGGGKDRLVQIFRSGSKIFSSVLIEPLPCTYFRSCVARENFICKCDHDLRFSVGYNGSLRLLAALWARKLQRYPSRRNLVRPGHFHGMDAGELAPFDLPLGALRHLNLCRAKGTLLSKLR
jgi:hypothetical protein